VLDETNEEKLEIGPLGSVRSARHPEWRLGTSHMVFMVYLLYLLYSQAKTERAPAITIVPDF
jgi:hypothetical protein